MSLIKKVYPVYFLCFKWLFFIFLLGTFSLGRAFSILHINTPFLPLFVTEIILFLSIPVILYNLKIVSEKLPPKFFCAVFVFFLMGLIYLGIGLIHKNLFVLRDIVLCGYILFLPITFITISSLRDLKIFLVVIILGNIFNLLMGRFLILNVPFSYFLFNTKSFNLGLYYGIVTSFLFASFCYFKKRIFKVASLVLIAINIYMMVVIGIRTVWVALLSLLVFFLIREKTEFIKKVFYLAPILIIISVFFYIIDFRLVKNPLQKAIVESKAKTMIVFVKELTSNTLQLIYPSSELESFSAYSAKKEEESKDKDSKKNKEVDEYTLDNIVWRLSIWEQAIKFGLESPLRGRGFGVHPRYIIWGIPSPSPERVGINSGVIPPHNHLIAIFYKMGVIGLGLFLFINIYVFILGFRYWRRCESNFIRFFLLGSLGSFVFWHTMASFFDVIESPPTTIFLWIIIGLIFSSVKVPISEHKWIG